MRRLSVLVSIILLASLTIGLKIAVHDPTSSAMEDRVASLLARSGWARSGVADLTADGEIRVERFRHASCREELQIMALPPRPDVLGLAGALSRNGARLVFVYRDTVSGHPPASGLLLYGRAMRYIARLRGRSGEASAILVAAIPPDCPAAATLPWDELR